MGNLRWGVEGGEMGNEKRLHPIRSPRYNRTCNTCGIKVMFKEVEMKMEMLKIIE